MGARRNTAQFNRNVPFELKEDFIHHCMSHDISQDEATAIALREYMDRSTALDHPIADVNSLTVNDQFEMILKALQDAVDRFNVNRIQVMEKIRVENDATDAEITKLTKMLTDSQNTTEQNRIALDQMRREYDILKGENTNLVERIRLLTHEKEGLQREVQALEDAKKRIDALTADLSSERKRGDNALEKLADISIRYLGDFANSAVTTNAPKQNQKKEKAST